jgi:ketosteroid isomerase-like protein
MDSVAGRPRAPRRSRADSPNLMVVKNAFDALEAGGVEAALELLLSRAHADIEFRPYLAPERVLRGVDEVRDFFREQFAAGTTLTLRTSSIEEDGEEVVVTGSLRVVRPTGGFSESQLRWTYRFRDGLLRDARWGPRQAA